jgi:glutamyl endopeptidase
LGCEDHKPPEHPGPSPRTIEPGLIPRETLSSWPWCAICHLDITRDSGSLRDGTGWLVAPQTVITAAHNLFDHSTGSQGCRKARRVIVTPARYGYGDKGKPYGEVESTTFWAPEEWATRADPSYDVAAIRLPHSFEKIGFFGVDNIGGGDSVSEAVYVAGYPAGSSRKPLFARVPAKIAQGRVFYHLHTKEGWSGGPVWWLKSGENQLTPWAIGVHTQGIDFPQRFDPPMSSGVCIANDRFLREIKEWIQK